MKTNLSSQISLHRVSPRYYRPENAFEKSVLTRLEKIPTDIYESVEEGANYIAREIAQTIRENKRQDVSVYWLFPEEIHPATYIPSLSVCIRKRDLASAM